MKIKGKSFPLQGWRDFYGVRRLRRSEFVDKRYMKVVRLTLAPTVFTTQGISLVLISVRG
jgi:hypothetical protein